jgi:ATP-binding cassette, subfamily B, bacterial HlyB/CyaB
MTAHTSISSAFSIFESLREIAPFNLLTPGQLRTVAARCQRVRYRIGESILVREKMPSQVVVIGEGQARLLGHDQRTETLESLGIIGAGEILGWLGLVRGIPCETAIASTEVVAITLAAEDFWELLLTEPQFKQTLCGQTNSAEVFELLSIELQRQAQATANLKDLALQAQRNAIVLNLPSGPVDSTQLAPHRLWLVSAGVLEGFPVGSRLPLRPPQSWQVTGKQDVRLLGLQIKAEQERERIDNVLSFTRPTTAEIPYASEQPPSSFEQPVSRTPFVRGRGPIAGPLACFQMLSQSLGVPFRKDSIRRVLENQFNQSSHTDRTDHATLTLQMGGAIAEMIGLRAQVVTISVKAIPRLKLPALIQWQDSWAVLYRATEQEFLIADPERGMRRYRPQEFAALWGEAGPLLQVEAPLGERSEKFSLRWFLPSIRKYRRVLTEVLFASFFIQLFGLANPLITQVIIDKVLVQHSLDTLDVLGVFLLGVAVFEALLTSLRTYLFTDTTNRIDLSLGSEVMAHLLRLPLSFFDRRRIGELAGRFNELENIRQFLTGTALTVVMDAVFSVIYIAVMLFYSWQLSLVTLATVPLFGLLTLCVSPIVRQQLQTKAERYADAQAYLVEVLSGMQTVKAQNIELKSRWQWQERYAHYIRAGFQSVLTFGNASSVSGFLNKLSGLLLLWVGAHLVLANQLTLGQLIAFRIIASYVTSPLLRLIQLWQNFQETALSIERLGDILDTPQEVDENDRNNIALPEIQGAVNYTGVSFGFNPKGNLQLLNINLNFPAGTFVGIVGQSGSGKSTLTKLLPRLYEPTAGQIQIDGYDICKVELNSLRRQMGVVLQDTLLFNGTIQENIALTRPEASSDEVIAAAKMADAHDFIMSLANGYNTMVGERGSTLSGGQRQRIAIARAVLQNPRLLILDEATSALDYDTEQHVCQNLAAVFRGRTLFFITHRLNTIKNADVILVMDKGAVVEQGTHSELIALKGRYYCLYQQQESSL